MVGEVGEQAREEGEESTKEVSGLLDSQVGNTVM